MFSPSLLIYVWISWRRLAGAAADARGLWTLNEDVGRCGGAGPAAAASLRVQRVNGGDRDQADDDDDETNEGKEREGEREREIRSPGFQSTSILP